MRLEMKWQPENAILDWNHWKMTQVLPWIEPPKKRMLSTFHKKKILFWREEKEKNQLESTLEETWEIFKQCWKKNSTKHTQHMCQLIYQSQPIPQNILRGSFVPYVGTFLTTRAHVAVWDIAHRVAIPPTKTPGASNGHHDNDGNTMQAKHQMAGILSCILHYMVSKFKMLISSIACLHLQWSFGTQTLTSEHQAIKEKT